MTEEKIKDICEKMQYYLDWMTEHGDLSDEMFALWFGTCLRKIALEFWLDQDEFWVKESLAK